MKEELTVVKNSGVHGKGLFAKKGIKADTLIGELECVPTEEDGPYVLWVDETDSMYEVSCCLKYINHSKEPNVAYYDDLTVVALRDIKRGEELLHDYGEDCAFE